MNFINNAEMAGLSSEGFAKTEVRTSESGGVTTTTIYAGKPGLQDPSPATDNAEVWMIKRTVVEKTDDLTTVTETWAEGSWANRESLTYKYL